MVRVFFILAIFMAAGGVRVAESQPQTGSTSCLKLILPLDKKRQDVQSEGGIWGLFSKTPSLSRHSSTAIQVDSQVNKLVSTLNYLCETRSGVPLNELASYVSRKVAELGMERFKDLHRTLGKPEKDIENWLAYTKIANANRNRVLDFEKIKKSIQDADGLINQYWNLFMEFKDRNKVEPLLSRATSLGQEIEEFLSKDPYMALAIFEDSQIPFWDIDENHGGS